MFPRKKTNPTPENENQKSIPPSKQPLVRIPFTIEQLSRENSKSLEEARSIVGVGISSGVYEAAGENLYRMTKEAVEAHEMVAQRAKSHFDTLMKYGFLGPEAEEGFKRDMKYLKMEGWEGVWV